MQEADQATDGVRQNAKHAKCLGTTIIPPVAFAHAVQKLL